jgi:hypothetical protein
MLNLGSPQFEIQQNPIEFKPVAEPVEGLILSSSCPENYLRNKCRIANAAIAIASHLVKNSSPRVNQ